MGCCSSQTNDANQIENNVDAKKQQEVHDTVKEIQQNFEKPNKDQSHSKPNDASVSNAHQSNLPNSKNAVTTSFNANNASEKHASHNHETQPDGKPEDKIWTEVSQDMHEDNFDDNEEDEDEENDQVINIIDQLINEKRENMES